jgi:hypothetical protein
MNVEADPTVAPAGSQREMDLEAKLSKRTLLLGLFVFLAATELLVMIELVRQTS